MAERVDTLGMYEAAVGLPEQVEAAAAGATNLYGLPDHDEIQNVLVLGMGGSGIAGDVVKSVAGPFMPVPVVIQKGYVPPNFVDESTLVFAVSFSGNTEETIEAAGAAAAAGGRMVVICHGGKLANLAESWHAPLIRLADGIPMPRAGIGAVAIPPLLVLEQIGLFPGASSWVAEAVDQLKRRRDELTGADNPARRLAQQIDRTLPIVYGGGGLGEVAALRWKNEFNENPKVPAFLHTYPELCHNEVAGWGQHGDLTRQVFSVIQLRHDHEHPQVMRRIELVADILDEVVGAVHEVRAGGDGALAQLFDLILLGTWTSIELAGHLGVDPGPIPVLDDLKAALAD